MRNIAVRIGTGLAAVLVSSLAVALAWSSAMERATTERSQLQMACLGMIVVAAAHMLPALRRHVHPLVLWPTWLLCFALACFGHATWFYLSSESASEVRAAGSVAARAVAQERHQIEQTLSTIRARPVSTVAAQLARASDDAKREALAIELEEARRAAGLRDRLILLSGYTPGTTQVQPGTPRVHTVPGEVQAQVQGGAWHEHGATLVAAVVAALLLEVLGAMLWSVAFAGARDSDQATQARVEPVQAVVQQAVNFVAPAMSRPGHVGDIDIVDDLSDLRAAIARGECRLSVRGIREYAGVGADRAAQIRRQLLEL